MAEGLPAGEKNMDGWKRWMKGGQDMKKKVKMDSGSKTTERQERRELLTHQAEDGDRTRHRTVSAI